MIYNYKKKNKKVSKAIVILKKLYFGQFSVSSGRRPESEGAELNYYQQCLWAEMPLMAKQAALTIAAGCYGTFPHVG